MKVIAVINQKGGVGKTTTVLSVGACLAQRGQKVLLVDFDSSGNLTLASGGESQEVCTAYEMVMESCSAEDAIQEMPAGYDLIAANANLAGAEGQITDMIGKVYRLKESLEPVLDKYDWIFIDTPPNLGFLTINALIACTDVLIPSEADFLSAKGIVDLIDGSVRSVMKHSNSKLNVLGIVLTKFTANTKNSKNMTDMIQQMGENFNIKVFNTVIRNNVAVKASQSERKDIFQFNSKANAAKDYEMLVDELLAEVKKDG